MAQRRTLIALLALGSAAAVSSCGATNEPSSTPPGVAATGDTTAQGPSAAGTTAPDGDEDGGVHRDRDHERSHILLVRGGEVTFVGLSAAAIRCLQGDGDGGIRCPDAVRFSGSVLVQNAELSLVRRLPPRDGDAGVVGGAPDGGDGSGTVLPGRQAILLAERSHLALSGGGGVDGDAGVPGTAGDTSARLHGGRIRLFLGGGSDGDGGIPFPDGDGGVSGDAGTPTPDGDGGISGDGGTSGSPRILRRIRDVRIENAILRFRGGSDADGG